MKLPDQQHIYLIRHGHPDGICGKVFLGHTDPDLSEKGRMQAKALSDHLLGLDFPTVFCSDLLRARHTAEPIAQSAGRDIRCLSSLREINLGCWDGKTHEQIKSEYHAEFEKRGEDLENYVIEGGESFFQCMNRAFLAITNIILEQRDHPITAIVSHAGFIRSLFCKTLGLSIKSAMNLEIDYGSISILSYDRKRRTFKLRSLNYIP